MFKIGDFSKLSQVAVSTLRYYDELGLLRPARIDQWTGYRWYAPEQLPRLNRILALRDLGFSLEQIGQLLEQDVPPAELRGMLRLRQAELQQELRESQSRLARIEARLRMIEQEDMMNGYDVVLKQVQPLTILAARKVVPTIDQMGQICQLLFSDLMRQVGEQGLHMSAPCFTIYYNPEYTERDIDVEAAVPVADARQAPGARVLSGAQVASVIHEGPFSTIGQAYNALGRWIASSGYQICGPAREIYLNDPGASVPLTEIQFPVEPGAHD